MSPIWGFGRGVDWEYPPEDHAAMPQVQLPVFPAGTTSITPELAFEKRDGRVVYFNGHLPVYMHPAEELGAFRLYTSQLIANGTASERQIVGRRSGCHW